MSSELTVVVDFGAQYNQLIARRIRESRVYCEIWPPTTPVEQYRARNVRAIVLSGGPASVYAESAPRIDPAVFELGIPVLGICYGMQLMAYELGGDVRRAERGEYGKAMLSVEVPDSPLLRGLDPVTQVWMSHGDSVISPPPGFQVLARTDATPTAVIGDPARRLYGVQFHPEVVHTVQGKQVLENFLFRVCGLRGDWTVDSVIDSAVAAVRRQVGETGRALVALSGGVDSSVAAVLVHRAIGDRLTAIFVDHGLLRAGEAEQVTRTFRDHFHIPLVHVDAADRFLARLRGVTDPEEKRRIVGREFIRVFEEEARRLGEVGFLVQGTIYPDVVESGASGGGAVIKTHHNVGGIPEDLGLELVEPLRLLFKDEVREVGRALGLPDELVGRHPFPGPGLAIRVLGEVTPERLAILRQADAIFLEEIRRAGLYDRIWQAFAVLPDVRSVGVMGDGRTYAYPIVLRAVTSEDGMTADFFRFPYEVLERIMSRIVGEVPHVNRVVYDITTKPPGTIEWE
ncbi:glutamine-hydrolyzing GMP synthase [Caldinitratiruptor microaerophilus]|uniref:GMP synthase [glutamine-hydrolyzing] n=1 Tax=Caldinitratiruptor microaerophilus TaxID=671077 RepID=A0AA35CLA0_9FIRM|nr:glutamine-hydrolyzing GMP synthase [Caldinitratiruptor microaerophilus]BDG61292.1 GMP synthase [glutamine-hydrolyzing] [Caldinitratiruptor microaerophilus]